MREAIKESERCGEFHTCYLAYTKLGMQALWSNPRYSLEQFRNALDIYDKVKDDEKNKALILTKMAAVYTAMSDFGNASDCYNRALEISEKNGFSKTKNEVFMGIAGLYWHQGIFDKAVEYSRKGISTAEGATLANSQLSLVRCYIDADSLTEARNLVCQIRLDSSDYINKYLKQRYLADIALRTNDYSTVSESIDSAYQCMEDGFFHLEQEKAEYRKDLMEELSQKELLKEKHEQRMRIITLLISLLIMLSLFLLLWARYRYINEKQKTFK